jgi:hypothetical protein
MSGKSNHSFEVFAVVKRVQTDVVCAAHPTEARRPNYRPPFRFQIDFDSTSLPTGDSVLQNVGSAQSHDDGSYRIHLTEEISHSRALILKPKQAELGDK